MKNVVITGASSGIGEALAREFANRGYGLGLVARREERLQSLKDELSAKVPVAVQAVDVADDKTILPGFEALEEELGGIDIVVANAGITNVNRTGKDDFENERRVIQVNLIGGMATVDAAARLYRRNKQPGQIVGISSVSAYRGIPGSAAYSGSKAGFSNYLDAVRLELKNKKISVTAVHPGFVQTELADNMEKYPFVIPAEKAAKEIINGIEKKAANVIVPKMPWSVLRRIMPTVPDALVSRFL